MRSKGLIKILIIVLLLYCGIGIAVNLFVLDKTIDEIREAPIAIFEAPYQYIQDLISNRR
ncbi:MAG: hypothetical protein ISS48_00940 [Candidatus Aenigmarchaeota archaeon]|nr:hypothetical protein [Candidatus Aenigmarchaeota archaeon]